jgi:hypothetical protein
MTVQFSKRSVPPLPRNSPMPSSGLVRRLLFRSPDDAAKQRILTCMLAVDDARLLKFGLTPEDIVILRTTERGRSD